MLVRSGYAGLTQPAPGFDARSVATRVRARVELSREGNAHARRLVKLLALRGNRMLRALAAAEAELSLLLCDDAAMHALNARYRKIDRTTDVLAFPLAQAWPGRVPRSQLLGDIVISIDTARAQAARAGRSLEAEATELLAHGLLHLLGLDHRDENELRRMRARTDLLVMAALTDRPRVGNPMRARAEASVTPVLHGRGSRKTKRF